MQKVPKNILNDHLLGRRALPDQQSSPPSPMSWLSPLNYSELGCPEGSWLTPSAYPPRQPWCQDSSSEVSGWAKRVKAWTRPAPPGPTLAESRSEYQRRSAEELRRYKEELSRFN